MRVPVHPMDGQRDGAAVDVEAVEVEMEHARRPRSCAAKASLSSTKSKSESLRPCFVRACEWDGANAHEAWVDSGRGCGENGPAAGDGFV